MAGTSSGGCASTILGTSGNSPLFRPYPEEIGTADARDDVFCVMPSCPVTSRTYADAALVWDQCHGLKADIDAFFAYIDPLL